MRTHSTLAQILRQFRDGTRVHAGRFRQAGTLAVIVAVLFCSCLSILPFLPVLDHVEVGMTVASDVIARRDIVYTDQSRTEELRKQAMNEVAPIYKFDSTRLEASLKSLESIVDRVIETRSQDLPADQTSQKIAAFLMTPAGATTKYLATCSESEVQSAKTVARQALTTVMRRGILEDNLASARESINTELQQYALSDNQIRAAYVLAARFVTSNLIYDESATMMAREKAASSVPPVVATIPSGAPVVKAGTLVDAAVKELLLSSGLVWGLQAWRTITSQAAVVVLAWMVVVVAVLLREPTRSRTQHVLVEVSCMGCSSIVVCWLAGRIAPALTPFLLCLLLGFAFFEQRLAVVFGVALMVVSWVIVPVSTQVIMGLIVGALVVHIIMRQADKMTAALIAGPVAGCSAAVVFAAVSNVAGESARTVAANAGYLAAGGLIAATFAMGMTFLFERQFNVATAMRLRELLDTGSKLLSELFERAPGTYHHSLNVANLASGAAQRIGANWLLARVGGYYHDIGKLLHPQFFGENRGELPNIHEDISPELSTKVILEHVQAGVTIAASYHLPTEVVDIIAEHHGTTVVQFFYDKASADQANLSPQAFRYPGPMPHSREASLVFLSDAVEAAARSLAKVDKAALEGLIESVVNTRISDGQLTESQLTLREIGLVKEYFLTSLLSFYHVRDAYSSVEEANEKS